MTWMLFFFLSTKTSYQSHYRCSGNSNGSECYPHTWTDQQTPYISLLLQKAKASIHSVDSRWRDPVLPGFCAQTHSQFRYFMALSVPRDATDRWVCRTSCLWLLFLEGNPLFVFGLSSSANLLLFQVNLFFCFFSPSFTTLTHFRRIYSILSKLHDISPKVSINTARTLSCLQMYHSSFKASVHVDIISIF